MSYHLEILMPVALSAFAGLRPSEALNVRREDSILGPGLKIEKLCDKINSIQIDLSKELILRSDLKRVGKIKCERIQLMDPLFYDIFYFCYKKYLDYVSNKAYEVEYGPLTINRFGKAMTYSNYKIKFENAFNEIRPILLSSGSEKLISFSNLLSKYNVTPHILRHWFSVQIALNYPNLSILMSARGDKDPNAAKTYLENKSELAMKYKITNDYLTDYLILNASKK